MRFTMLCNERSSEPTQNIARTSAFFASLAAKPSRNSGKFKPRSIYRYNDNTRALLRPKSSTVAHIRPIPNSALKQYQINTEI